MKYTADLLSNVCSDIRGENYIRALELEKSGHKILKLNTGNPATFGFEMPKSVKTAINENLHLTLGYCDVRGMAMARKSILDYHAKNGIEGLCENDIFIGNGVSEIASMVATALFSTGDEVLVPTPCYSLWSNEIILRGATPVFYRCDEQNEWNPDTENIEKLISNKTKAILIINPNNPTGAVYSREILLKITEIARKNKLIILSDEIYDRLLFDGAVHTSIASLSVDVPVITMNGLSKSHCLCGFRCGWLAVSGEEKDKKEICNALLKIASIRLSANAIMQTVIPAAISDTEYTASLLRRGGRLYEQRKATFLELDKIEGLSYVKNKAGFYVFPKLDEKLSEKLDDSEFAKRLLLEKHILLVPGSGFSHLTKDHFRIVMLPKADELKNAVRAMGEFLLQI